MKDDAPARLSTADLERVFDRYAPMVFQRARRILGNAADAEDALQEVFIRAFRSVDGFRGRSSITTWLYSITTHYCLNLLRDRARQRQLLAERYDPDDPTSLISPAQLVLLRNLLAIADEELGRAAVCVYLEGMSQAEAAEVLGVSPRTVGNHLDRFRELARAHTATSPQLSAIARAAEKQRRTP
jgi:RNA polymerase sigma-70 factor (ECF subfamily)